MSIFVAGMQWSISDESYYMQITGRVVLALVKFTGKLLVLLLWDIFGVKCKANCLGVKTSQWCFGVLDDVVNKEYLSDLTARFVVVSNFGQVKNLEVLTFLIRKILSELVGTKK